MFYLGVLPKMVASATIITGYTIWNTFADLGFWIRKGINHWLREAKLIMRGWRSIVDTPECLKLLLSGLIIGFVRAKSDLDRHIIERNVHCYGLVKANCTDSLIGWALCNWHYNTNSGVYLHE